MVDRIVGRIARATGNLAALLLLATVISNAFAVVFRYGIGQPLVWTEEVQRYLMVWVAFLGSVACLGRGDHMALDLVSALLPAVARRSLRIVLLALTAVFCGVLAWKGIPLAVGNLTQVSPAARIPMMYPYLAVGVGAALMVVVALLRICAAPSEPPANAGGTIE